MSKPSPYQIYLAYCVGSSLLFATAYTVAAIYRVQVAGLDPFQLVLVGTTLEVTYFLFNVPTGVVADTYSRRLSVVIGVALWGVGLLLEGSIPRFSVILIAQVIGGIGYTFVEGAIEAWLTDEVGEEQVGPALLRGQQLGQVAALIGIGLSVGLASVRLNLPLQVAGAVFLAGAALLLRFMREPRFQRPPRAAASWLPRTAGAFRDMVETTHAGARIVRGRPLALTILTVAALFGGFSEGFDRLWEAHFLTVIGLPGLGVLQPIVWFGIIEASALLLGVAGAGFLRRRFLVESPAVAVRVLFALETAIMVGAVLFALAANFPLAVAAYLIARVPRALVYPVYTAWINRGVDPRVRATVLSMSSQADALGQFTLGPAIGAIGSLAGLRVALTVAGSALMPAVRLYQRAMRHTTETSPIP